MLYTPLYLGIVGHTEYSIWYLVFKNLTHVFSSLQLLSRVRLFATPWTAAHQEFTQTHVY